MTLCKFGYSEEMLQTKTFEGMKEKQETQKKLAYTKKTQRKKYRQNFLKKLYAYKVVDEVNRSQNEH